MNEEIDTEDSRRFYRLHQLDAEQHAAEVKALTQAELARYLVYLRDIQSLNAEESKEQPEREISRSDRTVLKRGPDIGGTDSSRPDIR